MHDVRFLATHRHPDQVIAKYKEKLERKVKQCVALTMFIQKALTADREGLRDIKELKAVYHDKIRDQKEKAVALAPSPLSLKSSPSPPPSDDSGESVSRGTQSPQQSKPSAPPGIKTLSSFIDIPKILDLPQKEIEYIWRLRHAPDPQSLCAVIPQSTYSRLEEAAQQHPQFILPLPRVGQGAEIHFLQWTHPTPTTVTVLFTHLAEFKLRGEYSQPHTTVTHHLDLAESKGLVLLQGSVTNGRGITVDEGKWLLMCLQKFYGGGQDQTARWKLLEQFSRGDESFNVEALLEEAEKII